MYYTDKTPLIELIDKLKQKLELNINLSQLSKEELTELYELMGKAVPRNG